METEYCDSFPIFASSFGIRHSHLVTISTDEVTFEVVVCVGRRYSD